MSNDEIEAVARAICCKSDCSSIATYADTSGCGCVQWRDEAEAAIAALTALGWQKVPEGSVVVPMEPNEEMARAGSLTLRDTFRAEFNHAKAIYSAMLAARPNAGKGET